MSHCRALELHWAPGLAQHAAASTGFGNHLHANLGDGNFVVMCSLLALPICSAGPRTIPCCPAIVLCRCTHVGVPCERYC